MVANLLLHCILLCYIIIVLLRSCKVGVDKVTENREDPICVTIILFFASSHHYSRALPCKYRCCHCIISLLGLINAIDPISLAERHISDLRLSLDLHCHLLLRSLLAWRQGSLANALAEC